MSSMAGEITTSRGEGAAASDAVLSTRRLMRSVDLRSKCPLAHRIAASELEVPPGSAEGPADSL